MTVTARQSGGDLILDGRIAWASNLLAAPGAAISVTAAVDEDGRRLVVALPLDAAGVQIAPYPNLLALQATRSSSVILDGVRVPGSAVLADDLRVCLGRIRPTFLALQASFCSVSPAPPCAARAPRCTGQTWRSPTT